MAEVVVGRGSTSASSSSQWPTWQRTGSARPSRRLLDLGGELLADVELAAGDDDVGTASREGQHHRSPEAAAAAGDEGDLAGQVEARKRVAHGRWCQRVYRTSTERLSGGDDRDLDEPLRTSERGT